MHRPHGRTITQLPKERVVYVDRDLLVVDKPSGVVSTRDTPEQVDTLQDRVEDYLRRLKVAGPTWKAVKPVHRIDAGTSGLLLFARHLVSWRELKQMFRVHAIERSYLAIVHGDVAARTIRSFLAADRGDHLRGSVQNPGKGKLSITHVRPLQKLREATLVECRLETGRTHQIRVHLAEAGHPLLGDDRYQRDFRGAVIPADRVCLHATVLGLLHPRTRRPMRWVSPLPDDLQRVVDALALPRPEPTPNAPAPRRS